MVKSGNTIHKTECVDRNIVLNSRLFAEDQVIIPRTEDDMQRNCV